ncbi:MAG: serine hydrolase, partial [Alphaproteobacteria bacterium]
MAVNEWCVAGPRGRKSLGSVVVRYFLRGLFVIVALAMAPVAAGAAPSPAYIVVDAEGGKVLSHRSASRLMYPASVTKIMTAYVTFRAMAAGQLSKRSPVKVSRNALNQAPSKMGFKVGTVMTVDNALKMMIVKSANDI